MRILLMWGLIVVACAGSYFGLPVLLEAWAAEMSRPPADGTVSLSKPLAEGLMPALNFFVRWMIPLVLVLAGLKETFGYLARTQPARR